MGNHSSLDSSRVTLTSVWKKGKNTGMFHLKEQCAVTLERNDPCSYVRRNMMQGKRLWQFHEGSMKQGTSGGDKDVWNVNWYLRTGGRNFADHTCTVWSHAAHYSSLHLHTLLVSILAPQICCIRLHALPVTLWRISSAPLFLAIP